MKSEKKKNRTITIDSKKLEKLSPLTALKLHNFIVDNKRNEDRDFPVLELQMNEDAFNKLDDDEHGLFPYFIQARASERLLNSSNPREKAKTLFSFEDYYLFKKMQEYASLKLEDAKDKKRNSDVSKMTKEDASLPLGDEEDTRRLLGVSKRMLDIYDRIDQIVVTPKREPILILGETGTGKELVARAIWAKLRNKDNKINFASVNCAAVPPGLIESELFGQVKGAFPGSNNRPGLLETAGTGVVFLDEIGEIPSNIQAKLLRAINERKYRRVGEDTNRDVEARIIVATNRPIDDPMERAKPIGTESITFRDDLYYRISHHTLKLPTLRERLIDIPLLINHFSTETSDVDEFKMNPAFLIYYVLYPWPGNVRELQTSIAGFRAHLHKYTEEKRLERYDTVLGEEYIKDMPRSKEIELEKLMNKISKKKNVRSKAEFKQQSDSIMKQIEICLSYSKPASKRDANLIKDRILKMWIHQSLKPLRLVKRRLAKEANDNVPAFIQEGFEQELKQFPKLDSYWEDKIKEDGSPAKALGGLYSSYTPLSAVNIYQYIREFENVSNNTLLPVLSKWMTEKRKVKNIQSDFVLREIDTDNFQEAVTQFKTKIYWPHILSNHSDLNSTELRDLTKADFATIRTARKQFSKK